LRIAICKVAAVTLLATASPGLLAYRPFDSTDADVAADGEFELELEPVGWLRQGTMKFLVAPAVVGNVGLAGGRELVLQGQRQVLQDPEPDEHRISIVDTGLSIKQILRNGVLQDETGPSIATEYGLLLPEVHGKSGTGFFWDGIVSQRWEPMTVHLNAAASITRTHEPDLFLGAILEGPFAWTVRPVAEVFTEKESNGPRTNSLLLGAIWRVSKDLALDFGVREARSGGEDVHEIRLGFTWSVPWRT